MNPSSKHYDLHCFVCTNFKEKGQSCGPKGAPELRNKLKDWIKSQGLRDRVRINNSGCLDACEEGIALCLYPKQEWFTHVNLQDFEEIKKIILERLAATESSEASL